VLPKAAVDLPGGKAGEARTLVLAGGCFWCVEAVFEKLEGVTDVTSGYAGGTKETATYEQVSSGGTDHAESVRITYDPSKISYGTLLRVFFTIFDPTTLDRQGPDAGRQYRTAIFYANDEEKRVAGAYVKQLTEAKVFDQPIVTALEPLTQFYPAEEYHQDYVRHHPTNPYVTRWAVPKQHKVDELFAELARK
jgi:peptide-methionine (S)-S-oxide reductase